jgi:hypothetical protein
MSGALAVDGSGDCVVAHPTNSTAAIVVISSFILSIVHFFQRSGGILTAFASNPVIDKINGCID